MNDKNETDAKLVEKNQKIYDLEEKLAEITFALHNKQFAYKIAEKDIARLKDKVAEQMKRRTTNDTPQHLTTEEKILEEVKAIKKILGELK
jgi:hypothetical protein